MTGRNQAGRGRGGCPPKAEAKGSNPFGCASDLNGLETEGAARAGTPAGTPLAFPEALRVEHERLASSVRRGDLAEEGRLHALARCLDAYGVDWSDMAPAEDVAGGQA